MTMRVMGIRAEITGPCLAVGDKMLTMDVDGEDFGADVICANIDLGHVQVGDHLFVVGRVSLTNFDPKARRVFVQGERIDVLTPANSGSVEAVDEEVEVEVESAEAEAEAEAEETSKT